MEDQALRMMGDVSCTRRVARIQVTRSWTFMKNQLLLATGKMPLLNQLSPYMTTPQARI